MAARPRWAVVGAVGTAQTIAWAGSYYLPAILAPPMAHSFGVPESWVFGAVSAALILSALLGPWAGRLIDRRGGRMVLAASSLVFAAGLAVMAAAPGFWALCLGWQLVGLGAALGLYDAAFAALAGLYGRGARGAITGVTLIAGFASTVGWPVSAWMLHDYGWRGACLGWAALHLVAALPLHLLVPGAPAPVRLAAAPGPDPDAGPPPPRFAMPLLGFALAAISFATGAMSAHLPSLLVAAGATPVAAVAAAALIGPAQVVARVAEWGFLRRAHPLHAARGATLCHPLAAVLLVLLGAKGATPFVLVHGAGNGVLTIARGTLPLAVFGPSGYGARQGRLSAPARLVQAAAPFLFGLALARYGTGALVLSSGLCLAGLAALLLLRAARPGSVIEPSSI